MISTPTRLSLALIGALLLAGTAEAAASYVVRSGDTLYAIARRHGVSVRAIVSANGIADPNKISVGQRLVIPSSASAAPAPAPAPRPAPAPSSAATRANGKYVVTASALNVRKGPGTSHAKVGKVLRGKTVSVVEAQGAWRRIASPAGWVHSSYLRAAGSSAAPEAPAPRPAPAPAPSTSSASGTYVVTASALNVRSGPGTGNRVVGKLARGARVQALSTSGVWKRVTGAGVTGWVHGSFLRRDTGGSTSTSRPSSPSTSRPSSPSTSTSRSTAPQTRRYRKERRVGNSKVGANFVREMVSRHASDAFTFATDNSVNVWVGSRRMRAFGLHREVAARNLSSSKPTLSRRFELTVLGRNSITFSRSLTRTFSVGVFEIPVPVGPIVASIEVRLASTVGVSATVPLSWGGSSTAVTFAGSAGVGGNLAVGAGIPGVKVGVFGDLTLIRATLPARTTFTSRTMNFDVDLVLSSDCSAGVFAQVGFGFLSKRFSKTLVRFTLARTAIPIGSGIIRVGA